MNDYRNRRRALIALLGMLGLLIVLWPTDRLNRSGRTAVTNVSPTASNAVAGTVVEVGSSTARQQGTARTCSGNAGYFTESPDLGKADWAQLEESIAKMAVRSKSLDLLLLGAYMASDFDRSEELLALALTQSPEDPEVLWHAANLCASARDGNVCERGEWWDRLVLADAQNARAWMGYAAFYHQRGDAEKARLGLQRAASVPEMNGYFVESIQLYERAYAVSTDWSFQQRVVGAFGILAAKMPPINPTIAFCRAVGAESTEAADACMTYWQRMHESPMSNELESLIARDMIPDMLIRLNRVEEAEALRKKNQQSGSGELTMVEAQQLIDTNLVFERYATATPERFARFLELTRSHGERGARVQMLAERQALIDQGRLDPC